MAITTRIVALEKADPEKADAENRGFRVALWVVPPVQRQPYWKLAAPAKSQYANATQEENDAIANGALVESVETITLPSSMTMAEFQAVAEQRWTTFNTQVQAYNPWRRYGTKWDGTTWTLGGVN